MFLETALVLVAVGFLTGIAFSLLVAVKPYERRIRQMHRAELRNMRDRLDAWNAGAYRANLRREHLGTPYIAPSATAFEQLLVDIAGVADDHNGSRKAPELRVVS